MAYSLRNGQLHCEDVPLSEIAQAAGTPVYVYSAAMILERFRAYEDALAGTPHRVCYAVKANSNLSLLRLLAKAGAGFDIVSGGELFRVIKAGGDPRHTVFSGVGKTAEEIAYALDQGIHSFNCESEAELQVLNQAALAKSTRAQIALRVNPDVDPKTHPYISTGLRDNKFGIDIHQVEAVYARAHALPGLLPNAVSCHIGSGMMDYAPILEALDKVLALVERLRAQGIPITELDFGGGLGVAYRPGQQTPAIAPLVEQIKQRIAGRDLTIMVEPGRSIVAEAGVLVTRVLFQKINDAGKRFIVVDAAMNDLIRPALYQAWHDVDPVQPRDTHEEVTADIVGPVCESGDFLAKDRAIAPVHSGDLLAIRTAGAYGFTQASNYNSRPRPAEILVEGAAWRTVRQRETFDDLIRGEG